MAPSKRDVKEGKGKSGDSDREKECLISEDCKRELDGIREEIKKGNYLKVKDVKGLARRCGLEK